MGALTDPVFLQHVRVFSGDVVRFEPKGLLAALRRPRLAVVDARDRSTPYLVAVRRSRVVREPLTGHPLADPRRWRAVVYRLPGIDRTSASAVAARAAWRPGEAVHHPDYDCGRRLRDGAALVRDAYEALGVEVEVRGAAVGPPLRAVRSLEDPPHRLLGEESPGARPLARRWLSGERPLRPE